MHKACSPSVQSGAALLPPDRSGGQASSVDRCEALASPTPVVSQARQDALTGMHAALDRIADFCRVWAELDTGQEGPESVAGVGVDMVAGHLQEARAALHRFAARECSLLDIETSVLNARSSLLVIGFALAGCAYAAEGTKGAAVRGMGYCAHAAATALNGEIKRAWLRLEDSSEGLQ